MLAFSLSVVPVSQHLFTCFRFSCKETAYISRFGVGGGGTPSYLPLLVSEVLQSAKLPNIFFFTSIIKFPRCSLRVTRPQKYCVRTFGRVVQVMESMLLGS